MLAALCLAMVFAISLSSYIALCYVSLGVSTRAVSSAHSAELAEAGVEQALYAYNSSPQDLTGWTLSTVGSTTTYTANMTMTSSGFVATSSSPTAFNYGNGAIGTANITMTAVGGALNSISSQGEITLPNGSTTNGSAVTNITRTLSAAGAPHSGASPLFVNAVAALTGLLKFQYAGAVDSYDSGPAANHQLYNAGPGGNAGWSAVVLSQDTSTFNSTVRLTNAAINGYAVGYDIVNPSSTNWLSYGGSATIQGKNSTSFIDSTRLLTTPVPYQPVFPELTPTTNGNLPPADCTTPTSNILGNSCTLGSTSTPYPVYYANGINLTSGIVTITGSATIVVYGNISITGNAAIQLTNGSSLAIFVENGNVNINCTGSNAGIVNLSAVPLAKNCAILGTNDTNSSNQMYLNQTPAFYGVIYFPYIPVVINNSGTGSAIYGSIIGQSVTLNNSPVIHYDVELRQPDSTVGDVAFSSINAPATVTTLVSSVP